MTPKPNPWERNLKDGQDAEKIALQRLNDWLLKVTVDDYADDMNMQKMGIDGKIGFTKSKYQIKARDYGTRKYMVAGGDILFELEFKALDGRWKRQGWYYTIAADYVAYCWWNPKKTDFYEGYLLRIQDPRLRTWFNGHKDFLKRSYADSVAAGGNTWRTENAVVPIKDFPEGTIFQFIREGQLGWGFHKQDLRKFLGAP